MTDMPGQTRGCISDLPLEERRRLELAKQRELEDGFTRRHHIATYRQRYLAAQFTRVLSIGPALKATLDRLGRPEG